jgi:hypothetical protein
LCGEELVRPYFFKEAGDRDLYKFLDCTEEGDNKLLGNVTNYHSTQPYIPGLHEES